MGDMHTAAAYDLYDDDLISALAGWGPFGGGPVEDVLTSFVDLGVGPAAAEYQPDYSSSSTPASPRWANQTRLNERAAAAAEDVVSVLVSSVPWSARGAVQTEQEPVVWGDGAHATHTRAPVYHRRAIDSPRQIRSKSLASDALAHLQPLQNGALPLIRGDGNVPVWRQVPVRCDVAAPAGPLTSRLLTLLGWRALLSSARPGRAEGGAATPPVQDVRPLPAPATLRRRADPAPACAFSPQRAVSHIHFKWQLPVRHPVPVHPLPRRGGGGDSACTRRCQDDGHSPSVPWE